MSEDNKINNLMDDGARSSNRSSQTNNERLEGARARGNLPNYKSKLLPTAPDSPVSVSNPIAIDRSTCNFLDTTLKDFFSSEDGDRYLAKDTASRPVHILADFNYVPLNFDLTDTS